jgi:hypothetical protein
MLQKTIKYDDCVIAQHKIQRHQVVVINDTPINGMMLLLLNNLIDRDKCTNLVYKYLSGGINMMLGWIALYGRDDVFENDTAILALQDLAEMVMYHDKLKRKEDVEIDPDSDNPTLWI